MKIQHRFELEPENCLFCGACASIAPEHFFVDSKKRIALVTLQPQTADQLTACRAAMINCPASAIRESATPHSSEAQEAPLA